MASTLFLGCSFLAQKKEVSTETKEGEGLIRDPSFFPKLLGVLTVLFLSRFSLSPLLNILSLELALIKAAATTTARDLRPFLVKSCFNSCRAMEWGGAGRQVLQREYAHSWSPLVFFPSALGFGPFLLSLLRSEKKAFVHGT